MRQPQPATPTPKQQLQTSALPCPEQAPELLAVVRRESTGKTLVVVKRGGDPVHVSEVLPEVLENILPEKQTA